MQLYARQRDNTLISASVASKGDDYFCLECNSPVRSRGGRHRRSHFFHVAAHRFCRQSGKTMVHLQVQCAIRDAIGDDKVQLERRFERVRRIADVVWEEEKLIFEVQCSPISALEIAERNSDYESLGYRVIWILHDMRYNRWRMTAAEESLSNSPHYFTNIDAEGRGYIYDQCALSDLGVRTKKLLKLPIEIASPFRLDQTTVCSYKFLEIRTLSWHTLFRGDLVDIALKDDENSEACRLLKDLEQTAVCSKRTNITFSKVRLLLRKVAAGYRAFFRISLEKACKR